MVRATLGNTKTSMRFHCKKYLAFSTKIKTLEFASELFLVVSIELRPMLIDRFFGLNKTNFLLNRSGHLTLKHVILEAFIVLG